MAADIIARGMAGEIQNQLSQIQSALSGIPAGFTFKGTVNTVADLPKSDVSVGEEYIIKNSGDVYVAVSASPIEWQKLNMGLSLYFN